MTEQERYYFNLLTQERTKFAEFFNSDEMSGFKELLSELYVELAHFVYELIQNADDAMATYVKFELYRDKLIFIHNGTKLFTISNPNDKTLSGNKLGHVNAIVKIAKSTKNEGNSIGKFGIGFKAVYQYTSTPHIYSPGVNFKIVDFVIPHELQNDYPGRKENETLFVIPFDRGMEMPSEKAYEDIQAKLQSLVFPNLFLHNIEDIEYKTESIKGSYKIHQHEICKPNSLVEGTNVHFITYFSDSSELKEEQKLWLFTRNFEGKNISLAFFADDEGHIIPTPKDYSAFCFFPTQEQTGLSFIIHAPFLLTPTREQIKPNQKHNQEMIEQLASLAADSLVYLRDISIKCNKMLINDTLFEIIPLSEADLARDQTSHISYTPFYNKIFECLECEAILPGKDSYATSEQAYWGRTREEVSLFDDKQLSELYQTENAKWIFRTFGRDETKRYGKNDLVDYIDKLIGGSIQENELLDRITDDFTEKQTIEWLNKLFAYINRSGERQKLASKWHIFLDSEGKSSTAKDLLGEPIVFLPKEGIEGFRVIHPGLSENEETLEALKKIGIQQPTFYDYLQKYVFPKYINNEISLISEEQHRKNFLDCFKYYRECPSSDLQNFINRIKSFKFVKCVRPHDGRVSYLAASESYIPTEDLKNYFSFKENVNFICLDQYLEELSDDQKDTMNTFLTMIGCEKYPRKITEQISEDLAHKRGYPKGDRSWTVSTYNGKKLNWKDKVCWLDVYLDGLPEILTELETRPRQEISKCLWDILAECIDRDINNNYNTQNENYVFRIYRSTHSFFNRYWHNEYYECIFFRKLKELKWLYNINNEIVDSKNIFKDELNIMYDTESIGAILLLDFLSIKERPKYSSSTDNSKAPSSQTSLSHYEYQEILKKIKFDRLINHFGIDKVVNLLESYENQEKIQNGKLQNQHLHLNHNITDKDNSINLDNEELMNDEIIDESNEAVINFNIEDLPEIEDEEFSNQRVDILKRLENKRKKVQRQNEHEIAEIDREINSCNEAKVLPRYSFGWFKKCLELEMIEQDCEYEVGKEITVSFRQITKEEEAEKTFRLTHPSCNLPQWLEELDNVPLDLYFKERHIQTIIEVMSVHNTYELIIKLRSAAALKDVSLEKMTEARLTVTRPAFLLKELEKSLIELGLSDSFNMQMNLQENISFIFGPPGTGKTTYIASKVIAPKMQSTCRILVLTPTNKAADVLTRRIIECCKESCKEWLFRFGSCNDDRIEQYGIKTGKEIDIDKFPLVTVITTIARFSYDKFIPGNKEPYRIKDIRWDYIIVDEASMIPLVYAIYPLYFNKECSFIFAGDPFQIAPIVKFEEWKNENIYTLVGLDDFSNIHTKPHSFNVIRLETQYRSIPTIGRIFSSYRYGGILKHFRKNSEEKSLTFSSPLALNPLSIIKFPVREYESIYRLKRLGNSTYQIYSAIFAFEFLHYVSSCIPMDNGKFRIGVISPYRAQADIIQQMIYATKFPEHIEASAGTIHGFQGDECEMIIALFNPPPAISTRGNNHINNKNIVNVSISRARDYLVLMMPDDKTQNIENMTEVRKIERLMREQSDNCMLIGSNSVEKLFFSNEFYIEDNTFTTGHQSVNVYGIPEKQYEVRSEDYAVDVQLVKNSN